MKTKSTLRYYEQMSARERYAGRLTPDLLVERLGHSFWQHVRELDLARSKLRELDVLHGGRGVTERSVHPPQQQPCLWPADPCTPRHQGVGQRAMVFVQGHALLRTLEARLGRVSLVDGLVEQLPRLGIGSR